MTTPLRRIAATILYLLGAALIIASGGSSDGAPTWSKSFGGEFFDTVASATPTADGGYLFVGNRDGITNGDLGNASGNIGALWVVKLDALGDIAWERKLGDATLAAESGESTRSFTRIVAAADGGAWLIGIENTPDFAVTDLVVARLDGAGQVLWTRSYDSDWAQPDSHFYPDGETRETLGAAVETPDGNLWIAAGAEAFVRDRSPSVEGRFIGVQLTSTYLLKLAADGSVLVGRHTNIQEPGFSGTPIVVRVLADGGAAVLVPESTHRMLLVTDAGGALRSKTALAASDTFVASGTAQPVIADVLPMRRTAIEGPAGDDGYVIVGQRSPRIDDSFIARYLASPRDADDPAEGEDRHEVTPLENDWRIEIPEISTVWVAAANCGPAPSVDQRCGVIVAGQGRDSAGAMILAGIDAEGNVGEFLGSVPGIESVCAIHQEPGLTGDGRLAFRLLASTLAGGSATFVIDDSLTVVPFSFVEAPGRPCGPSSSATFASDGEWAALSYSNAVIVSRTTLSGAERWRQSFPTTGTRWQRALTARQTDDDGDGALDDGYIIAGEIGSSTDQDERAALVIKLGPLGEIDWQRALTGLSITDFASPLSANVLAVHNSGYGLVAHDATGAARALKLDRTGTIIWQQSLWGIREYGTPSIASLSDGGWIVGSGQFARAEPAALVRLGSSGDTRWTRTLGNLETIDSIVETSDGNLVVAGRRVLDVVVAQFDASGVPLWSRRMNAVDAEALGNSDVRIGVAPDNGLMLATTIRGSRTGVAAPDVEPEGFQQDLLVQQFDSSGALIWARRYGGLYDDVLTSLTTTTDGGAILGARTSSLGDRNDRTEAWLLRIGPDGGISPTCAAELVPGEFAGILIGSGGVTSTATDRLALGAVDGTPRPSPVDASLITLPSGSPSTVARQCSGSVARSPNLPRDPVAHLRVIQGGAITGVVSSVPAGILCGVAGGGTCEADFDQDLLVTLNVDAGSRPTFESWTGCEAVNGTQCRVSMTADRTVTATFATEPRPPTVNLILNSITGRGRVTGTGGMSCHSVSSSGNNTCSVSLQRGSTVQLAASPDAGRAFLGWGGSCASFGNTRVIVFVMNEGQTCAAQFSGPPPGAPEISVEVQPTTAGNVTSAPSGIDCGASNSLCTEGFVSGTDVTLMAAAALPGWEFESFLCQGQPRTYERSIAIDGLTSNTRCRADFSNGIERLFVRVVRDIGDDVTYSRVYIEGGGLDCVRDCDRPFPRDQLLMVRAEPFPDYVLSGWSGCRRVIPDNTHPGAPTYCEVLMDQRHEVIAFFSRVDIGPNPLRSLVVNFENGSTPGLVISNPGFIDCTPTDGICVGSFNVGTEVRLDVAPGAGAGLTSDMGCDTLTPASGATPAQCRVTMNADRVVTFGFTRANSAPVAAYTFEPANPLEGQLVTFNASTSSDDNGISGYAWDFDDNGSVDATASVASHTYISAGTYTARLTVTDTAGVSDDEIHAIVVSPALPAVPVISTHPQSVTVAVGETAAFSVLASGVPPLSYRWQRGGVDIVPAATGPNYTTPAAALTDDGAVFRVIVTNAAGSTTSQTAALTVGRGWRRIGGAVETGPVQRPSLAIDAAGTRYVSYTNSGSLASELFVERFNGTAWESVGGGAVNPGSDFSTVDHTIINGADGLPIVAWNEGTRVRVARWTGTQWNVIGDNLAIDQSGFLAGQYIQLARAGTDLVAAWTEIPPPFNERRIAVKRYDAAAGTWSGDYIPDVFDAGQIRMSLDAAGLPAIAYVPRPLSGGAGAIQVVRQGASDWAPLGADIGPVPVANSSGLVANYGIGIKFDGTDAPVVFGSADGIRLFSFRHDGTAWQPLTGIDGVFVSLDPVNESTAHMEFTRGGPQIAMAYTRQQRQTNGGLRFITEFRSWNGSAWTPIGEPLAFLNYSLSPELTADGNPIFAGQYQPPGGLVEIVVQQFVP